MILGTAKGMSAAEQPDRLDQIGFAVGVLAVDHIDIVSRINAIVF